MARGLARGSKRVSSVPSMRACAPCSRRSAPRIASRRVWSAATTSIVASAWCESSGASARPSTGGPSITTTSKRSRNSAIKRGRRSPASSSGGFGGSGPDVITWRSASSNDCNTSATFAAPASRFDRPMALRQSGQVLHRRLAQVRIDQHHALAELRDVAREFHCGRRLALRRACTGDQQLTRAAPARWRIASAVRTER